MTYEKTHEAKHANGSFYRKQHARDRITIIMSDHLQASRATTAGTYEEAGGISPGKELNGFLRICSDTLLPVSSSHL